MLEDDYIGVVFLNSSITARKFYTKIGYSLENIIEDEFVGIIFQMKKSLYG